MAARATLSCTSNTVPIASHNAWTTSYYVLYRLGPRTYSIPATLVIALGNPYAVEPQSRVVKRNGYESIYYCLWHDYYVVTYAFIYLPGATKHVEEIHYRCNYQQQQHRSFCIYVYTVYDRNSIFEHCLFCYTAETTI